MEQCIVCHKPVPEYVPQYCCNGQDCLCKGLPIEPPICSDKCWDKFTSGREEKIVREENKAAHAELDRWDKFIFGREEKIEKE